MKTVILLVWYLAGGVESVGVIDRQDCLRLADELAERPAVMREIVCYDFAQDGEFYHVYVGEDRP